ncbi:DUF3558 domain-containing protein [Lentzea sp. NPDC003310]|uniref:DUF3558 domain-containing protein n=1 Tax=Lentzea sp. NPDC003310 TaxID=3154447 RepID=UPI0033B80087
MRIRTIVAGIAALALLAGCGESGGTTGTPTTTTQSSATDTGSGAPKIENPLDVHAFETNACGALTPAQLEAYGLPGITGRVNNTAAGGGCIWLGTNTPAKMSPGYSFLPEGTNISTILANKDTTYEAFEQLPAVQGYPTYMALVADNRKDGYCTAVMGVSNEKAMLFSFQSSAGSPKAADPCGAVTEFANLVITTIKAGAK